MPTFSSTVKVMGKQFHEKASKIKKQAQHDVAKIAYNALKDCPPDERRPELHYYSDKNLTEEASEVLWIGFPVELKVDESILRRAFDPFGEIEKISIFPGSRYAFVRYKSLTSACTAIGSLKGKLFGNPHVHICFAKNEEGGSSSSGKSSSKDLHGLPDDDDDDDADDDDDDDDERAPKKLKTGHPPPERELTEYPFDKRFTPELNNSSLTESKWEGTITEVGTPICRAHCFPVGKVPDMPLPEFLDCTARTSLDMLSKYYYQAVGVWVVFYLPGSDADDTELYNQFMHSLKERQQAAVSMLDNTTTLFLVPPSNFSEKVLKVPGSKLIISGVILRLDCSGIPYNLEMRLFDSLSSMPVGSLPPEQLAQPAASLPEQQRQSGRSSLNASALGNLRRNNRFNRSENNRVNYEPSTSQFGQVQQLQRQQQRPRQHYQTVNVQYFPATLHKLRQLI